MWSQLIDKIDVSIETGPLVSLGKPQPTSSAATFVWMTNVPSVFKLLIGQMKMAKSCEEGTAANRSRFGSEGHRFKTPCQQGLFTVESPLIFTLLLVICIHKIKSFDCTFALHVRDVTRAQCIKNPSGWWQPIKNYWSSIANKKITSVQFIFEYATTKQTAIREKDFRQCDLCECNTTLTLFVAGIPQPTRPMGWINFSSGLLE